MHLNQNAAANQCFFYRVAAIICNYVPFIICFIPFHTVSCKGPEQVLPAFQHNGFAAGGCYRRSRQNACICLVNRTIFRCKLNRSTVAIFRNGALFHFIRVCNRRSTGFHSAAQRYAFRSGNGNNRPIAVCCYHSVFMNLRITIRININIASPGFHYALDFCIVSCTDINFASPGIDFAIDLCIGSGFDGDIARIGIYAIRYIINPRIGSSSNGDIAI